MNKNISTINQTPIFYPQAFKSTKTSLSYSDKISKLSQKITLVIKEKITMIKEMFSLIRSKLCIFFKASENNEVTAKNFKSTSSTHSIATNLEIASKHNSILTSTTSNSISTNSTISAKTTSTNSSFDNCGLTPSQSPVTSETPQMTPRSTLGNSKTTIEHRHPPKRAKNTYTLAKTPSATNLEKKPPNLSSDEKKAISELRATKTPIPETYSELIIGSSQKEIKTIQEILKTEAAINVIKALIKRKKLNETAETKSIYQGTQYLGLQSTPCRILEMAAFNFLDNLNITAFKPYITVEFTSKKSGIITDKATENPIKDPIFSYLEIQKDSAAEKVLRKRFPIEGSKFNTFSGRMDLSENPISTTLSQEDWDVIVKALEVKKQNLEKQFSKSKKPSKSA